METLYDTIVENGGYVWQLFQDGPMLPKSKVDTTGKPVPPALCEAKLRENWCTSNSTAAMSAVLYAVHPAGGDAYAHPAAPGRTYNDSNFNEQATAGAKNAPLLSHFYAKTFISPRQARDKHRKNWRNRGVFDRISAHPWQLELHGYRLERLQLLR